MATLYRAQRDAMVLTDGADSSSSSITTHLHQVAPYRMVRERTLAVWTAPCGSRSHLSQSLVTLAHLLKLGNWGTGKESTFGVISSNWNPSARSWSSWLGDTECVLAFGLTILIMKLRSLRWYADPPLWIRVISSLAQHGNVVWSSTWCHGLTGFSPVLTQSMAYPEEHGWATGHSATSPISRTGSGGIAKFLITNQSA